MAGADFDADAFGDIDLSDIEDLQNLLQAIGGDKDAEKARNARLILERYVRDFEKSTQKKIAEVESKLNQATNRGAPRAKSQEDLTRQVDAIIERQKANFEKLGIQVEKEFDNITTRLQTQKGLAQDFDQIQKVKDSMDEVLSTIDDSLQNAKQNLMERGSQDMERRSARSKLIAARKEAQQVGEKAQQEYLEANKDVLESTTKEKVLGFLNRTVFKGKGFSVGDDQREQRRQKLIEDAQEFGRSKAGANFQEFLDSEPEVKEGVESGQMAGLKYVAPKASAGFRAQDVAGLVAGPVGAALMIASEMEKQILKPAEKLAAGLTGSVSGAKFASNALTQVLPKPVEKYFDLFLGTMEKIAENTADDITPFSGQMIQTNIKNQLDMLRFNMDRAAGVEQVLSTLSRSQNQFEIEMKRLGDELLNTFGPALVGLTEIGIDAAKALSVLADEDVIQAFKAFLIVWNPQAGLGINLLADLIAKKYKKVLEEQKQGADISDDLIEEIQDFFSMRGPNQPLQQQNNAIPPTVL